jgi:hypothetical protein
VVFFGLLPVLCSEREGPFFIPSPTIRFPERAQWGQGTETLAKLGALPPSGACVWQRLDDILASIERFCHRTIAVQTNVDRNF